MEGEEDTDAFQLSDLDYSVTEGPTQRRCLAGGEEEGRRQIEWEMRQMHERKKEKTKNQPCFQVAVLPEGGGGGCVGGGGGGIRRGMRKGGEGAEQTQGDRDRKGR